eukprot:gene3482-6131_t
MNNTDGDKEELFVATLSRQQLINCIPKNCFVKSLSKSLFYLLRDFLCILFLYYFSTFIPSLTVNIYLKTIIWTIWSFCQGVLFISLWSLAHECGHGSFSNSKLLNDIVGFILHSMFLVPYFSWKISHSSHHQNSNNFEKDEIWVPKERTDTNILINLFDFFDSNLLTISLIISSLLFGWPLYLFFNIFSNKNYSNFSIFLNNHFNPSSPIFKKRHYKFILISNFTLMILIGFLIYLILKFGFLNILFYYFIPYLWLNSWLILITFLQHTSKDIKYFDNSNWNLMKGSLQTIDRDFGILNIWFHGITNYHVCHHFFPEIPHYHLNEATIHLKKELKEFYKFDDTFFILALFNEASNCRFVKGNKIKYYVK